MHAVSANTIRIATGWCSVPTTENPSAVTNAITVMVSRRIWRRSANAVTKGKIVKRENDGTAVMMPIHEASTPMAFSQTGKNGRYVPTTPSVEA